MKKIIQWLLYILVFLLPFQTRLIVKSQELNGQYFEYGAISLYGTQLLLGLIVLLTIVFFVGRIINEHNNYPAQMRGDEKGRNKRILILSIIAIYLGANCFLAISPEIAFYKLTGIILAVAFFFAIAIVELPFEKLSLALVASGTLQSCIAMQQFMTQRVVGNKWLGMASQDPNTLGTPVVLTNAGRFLRSFGTLPHPNILAGFLVIVLIFIIGLYIQDRPRKQMRLIQLAFIFNTLGLLVTLSRSAIIAFVTAIILFLFFLRKNVPATKAITKLAILSTFIIILFAISYPDQLITRTFSTNRLETNSNNERLSQYADSGAIFKQYFLTGTGIGNYTLAVAEAKPNLETWQYQPIHNSYLLLISELGLAGILLVLGYFYWLIKKIRSLDANNLIATISLIAILIISILALFDHYLVSFWFGVMMVALVLKKTPNFKLPTYAKASAGRQTPINKTGAGNQ